MILILLPLCRISPTCTRSSPPPGPTHSLGGHTPSATIFLIFSFLAPPSSHRIPSTSVMLMYVCRSLNNGYHFPCGCVLKWGSLCLEILSTLQSVSQCNAESSNNWLVSPSRSCQGLLCTVQPSRTVFL